MYKNVQANMAANIESSILGVESNEEKEPLTEEEKQLQRPMVLKMFKELDADESGLLDLDEIRQLCNDLGITLTDEQYTELLAKIDEDGSGECDFDEFFDWYVIPWKIYM